MKLPLSKLMDIDYYEVEEMHKIDGWENNNNRYDSITIHYKSRLEERPFLFGFLTRKVIVKPKSQTHTFRRSKSPSSKKGWLTFEASDEYIELKNQIEKHIEELYI